MITHQKWRPGQTLIGLPDQLHGQPMLIQSMDHFFALAKIAAGDADDAIKRAMLGITSSGPQHHLIGPNCRCVAVSIVDSPIYYHHLKCHGCGCSFLPKLMADVFCEKCQWGMKP